jgi:hypothetical protein
MLGAAFAWIAASVFLWRRSKTRVALQCLNARTKGNSTAAAFLAKPDSSRFPFANRSLFQQLQCAQRVAQRAPFLA